MDKIINLGIPHVAEQIFEPFGIKDLNECLRVSETWKEIAKEVVVKRWIDKFHLPVYLEATNIVQVLLDNPKCDNINWNKTEGEHVLFHKPVGSFEQVTAFKLACKSGNLKMVKLFLKYSKSRNIDLNAKDKHGYTGFDTACIEGHFNIVKELLSTSKAYGINLSTKGLVWAITCNEDMAKFILKHPQGHLIHVPNNASVKVCLNYHDEETSNLIYQKWKDQENKM